MKPNRTNATVSWWAQTRADWLDLDLDPKPLAPVVAGLEQIAELHAAAARAKREADDTQRAARHDVALGRRTFSDVATELVAAQAKLDLAAQTVVMVKIINAEVTANMAKVADTLLPDHLSPAEADVVAELAELAPEVAAIATDADAMRADEASRETWARITYLHGRHSRLQQLAYRLRNAEVVSVAPNALPVEYAWRNPKAVAEAGGGPIRHFLASIDAGAEPAILSAEEVESLEAQRDEKLRQGRPTKGPAIVNRLGELVGAVPGGQPA